MRLINTVTGADYALDARRNNPTRLPAVGIVHHVNINVNGRAFSCPVNDNAAWAGAARPLYYVWLFIEGRARYVTVEQPNELDGGTFALENGRAKRTNPPRRTSNSEMEAERIRKFKATMAKRRKSRSIDG